MNEVALKQGIELVRTGNIPAGLRILAEIVKQDPMNDTAWVWLSACYTETDRKIYCLNRAVRINPKNILALEGLTHLGELLPVVEPKIEETATPVEAQEPTTVEPVTEEPALESTFQEKPTFEPGIEEPALESTFQEPPTFEPGIQEPALESTFLEPKFEPDIEEPFVDFGSQDTTAFEPVIEGAAVEFSDQATTAYKPVFEEPTFEQTPLEPTPLTFADPASVLSKFEAASSEPVEVHPPDWSVKSRRPRTPRKPRGKINPLIVILVVILVIILAAISYIFVPRLVRQMFPEASHFNENTQAFIQEVDLLMAISDGSNNLGAFKTQQGLVYKAYDKLLLEWPAQMIFQKNEIDTALKGWSAVGAISEVAKAPNDCKVEGSLLDEVKSYTNSLAIDKTCTEWASIVMDIANKHFNQARPGLESYPAR